MPFFVANCQAKSSGLTCQRQEHKVYVDEVKELKAQQRYDMRSASWVSCVQRKKDGDEEQTFEKYSTITHPVDEQKHAKVQSIPFGSSDRHRRHCWSHPGTGEGLLRHCLIENLGGCVQTLRTENRYPNCEGSTSQLVGDSFCRLPLCRPAANLPLDCRRSRCNPGKHKTTFRVIWS